jgi:hypothetical protein
MIWTAAGDLNHRHYQTNLDVAYFQQPDMREKPNLDSSRNEAIPIFGQLAPEAKLPLVRKIPRAERGG